MARPREFDTDSALDGAIAVFREHGFEGSSAQMLVDAMRIGRQSLYAAFGGKEALCGRRWPGFAHLFDVPVPRLSNLGVRVPH